MSNAKLKNLRVAILVSDDFEQAELEEPRNALIEAGAATSIVAPKAGTVQAMKHDEKTQKIPVDMTLDEAKPEDFDAVLLPGGALNADFLRMESKAQEFVRNFDRAKKPIAFICHAPWLLISAGLVKGRTLSGYHTIQDDIRNAGGKWKDEEVVRDGNWVSSRQPTDIPAFNREMIVLFSERKANAKSV
jgi:protease I